MKAKFIFFERLIDGRIFRMKNSPRVEKIDKHTKNTAKIEEKQKVTL